MITLENIWNAFFALDIFLNFVTTYEDDLNQEITSLPKIAMNYLQGWFFVDLISTVPISDIVVAQVGADSNNTSTFQS